MSLESIPSDEVEVFNTGNKGKKQSKSPESTTSKSKLRFADSSKPLSKRCKQQSPTSPTNKKITKKSAKDISETRKPATVLRVKKAPTSLCNNGVRNKTCKIVSQQGESSDIHVCRPIDGKKQSMPKPPQTETKDYLLIKKKSSLGETKKVLKTGSKPATSATTLSKKPPRAALVSVLESEPKRKPLPVKSLAAKKKAAEETVVLPHQQPDEIELLEDDEFFEDQEVVSDLESINDCSPEPWVDPFDSEYAELIDRMPGWVKFDKCVANVSSSNVDETELISCAAAFKMPAILLKNLEKMGWLSPVEIQRRTIPVAIAKGFDLAISAETGSGKTGAFVVPVLFDILNRWEKKGRDNGRVRCVAFAPTRELARQIGGTFQKLSEGTGIRIAEIFGGIFPEKQRRRLQRGKPHVIVATLGRLSEFIFGSHNIEAEPYLQNFHDWTHVILDEVDRLMEPGRIHSMRMVFDNLLSCRGGDRGKWRIYVASATADMNISIAKGGKLTTYNGSSTQFIPMRDKMTRLVKVVSDAVIKEQSAMSLPSGLALKISMVPKSEVKDQNLIALLTQMFTQNNSLKILVFCNSVGYVDHFASLLSLLFTRDLNEVIKSHEIKGISNIIDLKSSIDDKETETVTSSKGVEILNRLLESKKEKTSSQPPHSVKIRRNRSYCFVRKLSFGVVSLHSKKSQKDRFTALEKFADPEWSGVLVATDLPARGMDFAAVDMVVHLHQPRTLQTLIHRCGRTARGPQGSGLSVFFISPDEYQHYKYMFESLELNITDLPSWSLYDTLSRNDAIRVGEIVRLGSNIERQIHKVSGVWIGLTKRNRLVSGWVLFACGILFGRRARI